MLFGVQKNSRFSGKFKVMNEFMSPDWTDGQTQKRELREITNGCTGCPKMKDKMATKH